MTSFTVMQVQSILDGLKDLYNVNNPNEFPNKILSFITKIVPSEQPFVCEIDFTKNKYTSYAPELTPSEAKIASKMARQYYYEHPVYVNYIQTKDGNAYKISDFLCERDLYEREMYQQGMRQHGIEDQIAIVIPAGLDDQFLDHSDFSHISIGVNRSNRGFIDQDRVSLNLIRSHIIQVYKNIKTLSRSQGEISYLSQTIDDMSLVFTDCTGKIKRLTSNAELLLKRYDMMNFFLQGKLQGALLNWFRHYVNLAATDKLIENPILPLQIQKGSKCLVIRFSASSENNKYLLILEEQPSSKLLSKSLELLGIGKRESEVLFLVMKGKANKEIAVSMGISPGTVKKHLENIYVKLGVQSRTEAIANALSMVGVL